MTASALAVVPAAGAGRRFGGRKLLADVEGVPMIARTVATLLEAGVALVVVVVAPDSEVVDPLPSALDDPRVRVVVNPDPSRGMLSSVQAGLAETSTGPVLVLPADMPFVRPATIGAVVAAATERGTLVSPTFDGRRGHPIALTQAAARAVRAAGGVDLSAALEPFKADRLELAVDDPGIHRDIDTRDDL